MSQTETRMGKLKLIPRDNRSNLEYAEYITIELGKEFDEEIYNEYLESDKESNRVLSNYIFEELPYDKVTFINGQAFKILEDRDIAEEDCFHIEDLGNGEYSYLVSYYNGGCSFDEAIEYAFKKINASKSDN